MIYRVRVKDKSYKVVADNEEAAVKKVLNSFGEDPAEVKDSNWTLNVGGKQLKTYYGLSAEEAKANAQNELSLMYAKGTYEFGQGAELVEESTGKKVKVSDAKQYIQKGLVEFVVNDTHKAYAFGSVKAFNESYDRKGLEQHLKLTQEALDYLKDLERQGYQLDNHKAYMKDSKCSDGLSTSDIEFAMKELPRHLKVEGSGVNYKVSYDGKTVDVKFDTRWDEYTYTINGKGPYAHSSYEYIGKDIENFISQM